MITSEASPPTRRARRGLRRALGIGTAAAALGALGAGPALGAQIFPENGTFDSDAAGWTPQSTCTAILDVTLLNCVVENEWTGAEGNPPGSVSTTYRVLLNLLQIVTEGEGGWVSPQFVFRGTAHDAAVKYDRASRLEGLLTLGGKASHAVLLHDITAGTATLLREDELTGATTEFQTIAFAIPRELFQDNHVYRLEFKVRFESAVSLLAGASVLHDNVALAVDDTGAGLPPGFPGGTGGLPPFGQVLAEDACTMPERQPRQRQARTPTPGAVRLSREQLTINQRVSQAAVRRVNAVLDKFATGFTASDFRECSIRIQDFEPPLEAQIRAGQAGAPPPIAGRAGQAPRRTPSARGQIQLSRAQLLINQRISQAAVRRVNAVQARFRSGLLAGDIRGNTLTRLQMDGALRTALRRGTPDGSGAAAAQVPLSIGARRGGNPERVTLSRQQLLINQRISQAAVRRINAVQDQIAIGLTGANIKDGELRRANLADALQLPSQ